MRHPVSKRTQASELFSPRRLLYYGSVNLALIPLNLSIAWASERAGIHYLLATLAGFSVHVTAAFFINRHLTFQRPDICSLVGLSRAALVEMSGIIVVLATTYACVEWLHMTFITARICAVIVVGVWCYILDSVFTFAKPKCDPH